MSTATVVPTAQAVSTENFTYVKVLTGTEASETGPVNTYKVIPEPKEADDANAKKLASGEWKEVSRQTFKAYFAGQFEGIQELVPSEEEIVKMFNRGISVKQQNKARSLMLAEDFEPVDGAYDLREIVAEPTRDRGLTDEEKALKVLGKLDPTVLAAVLAQLKTA